MERYEDVEKLVHGKAAILLIEIRRGIDIRDFSSSSSSSSSSFIAQNNVYHVERKGGDS